MIKGSPSFSVDGKFKPNTHPQTAAGERLRTARAREALGVAAPVRVVGRVQRLVQVADQMQQELERGKPLCNRLRGIGQFSAELVDLVDHASVGDARERRATRRVCRVAEARAVLVFAGKLDVDEVPLARPPT